MLRQAKLMITVDIVLACLFIIANLIYAYLGNTPPHNTLWTPFWLTFYTPGVDDVGSKEPNFGFYLFWAVLLINIYFLISLGRTVKQSQDC
jgi:hypothetical protein